MKHLLELAVAVGVLSSCGAGPLLAIRSRATQEMSCPDEKLSVSSAGTAKAGPYYVEGCDQLRRYVVGCNIFDFCPDPQGFDAGSLVRRQAAFDLQCDRGAVSIEHLSADTFGVRGCGKQASYLLVCRGECRLVQNTQSQ